MQESSNPTNAVPTTIKFLFRYFSNAFSRRCAYNFSVFSLLLTVSFSPVIRSPRSSSSVVTPKISANTGSSEISGALSSRSHLLTALSDTLIFSASSFCVYPFAFRNAARNFPIVFCSIRFSFSFIPFLLQLHSTIPSEKRTPDRPSFSPALRESYPLCFSNPCTHFPLRNRYRKITELMHHVNGYAQNTTRISGIK